MEIICSAIAGIGARILCHPLDTIKTVCFTGFAGEHHLHSASAAASAGAAAALPSETPRTSFVSAARSIYAREGIAGFYRGVGVAAIGSAPGVALYLTTYDRCSSAWKAFGESKPAPDDGSRGYAVEALRGVAAATPTSARFFLCGLGAEAVSCLVWVPIDVSKERLQSQPPSLQGRYTSSLDALQRILANEGVSGLYRGYWSTLGSFGPFSAVYFVFYEYFTALLRGWYVASSGQRNRREAELSSTAKFTLALLAGAAGNIVASVCTNPLELVKTRLQVQRAVLQRLSPSAAGGAAAAVHPSLYAYHYDGLLDGLAQVVRTDGVRALWRGVGARVAYTAPNAALTMGFFEYLKSKLL